MRQDPAQYHRMIANLIKQGNIAQTDPAQGLVRVRSGDLTSDWLPYFVPAAGGVSVHRPPSVGENCIILSPSGEPANGLVLCGLASTQHPQPDTTADKTVLKMPDGAVFEYDHAQGSLKISGIKTAEIQAADSLDVDTKAVRIRASESLTVTSPQSTFEGALTVQMLLTYLGGMIGAAGAGGGTAISGSITHTGGDYTHSGGSLSSNGIVLDTHTHGGVTPGGGDTGAPQ